MKHIWRWFVEKSKIQARWVIFDEKIWNQSCIYIRVLWPLVPHRFNVLNSFHRYLTRSLKIQYWQHLVKMWCRWFTPCDQDPDISKCKQNLKIRSNTLDHTKLSSVFLQLHAGLSSSWVYENTIIWIKHQGILVEIQNNYFWNSLNKIGQFRSLYKSQHRISMYVQLFPKNFKNNHFEFPVKYLVKHLCN